MALKPAFRRVSHFGILEAEVLKAGVYIYLGKLPPLSQACRHVYAEFSFAPDFGCLLRHFVFFKMFC